MKKLILILFIVGCEDSATEPSQDVHYTCIIEYEELNDDSGMDYDLSEVMFPDTFVVHATNISDAIYLCERTSSPEELSTCTCEAGIN